MTWIVATGQHRAATEDEFRNLLGDALLPGDEGEALPKLEEEVVELVDQPLLQIALVKPSWFGDAEELEHVGVFEQVVG